MRCILALAGVAGAVAAAYAIGRFPAEEILTARGIVLVVIPATLAAACGGGLFMRSDRQASLALSIVCGGMIIFAAELWIALGQETKAEKIRAIRDAGEMAYPLMLPLEFMRTASGSAKPRLTIDGKPVLPLSGISRVRTVVCNEGSGWLTYVSDDFGFHNPPGLWQRETMDIVAIGDSFALGYCVGSEENAVARIRRVFPATLNLGFAGSGPLLELAVLTEYAKRFRARTVLWFFTDSNDLLNLLAEAKIPILTRYLEEGFSQKLFGLRDRIDIELKKLADTLFADAEVDGLIDRVFLRALRLRLGLVYHDAAPSRPPRMDSTFPVFKQVLRKARDMVGGWGGTIYLVYVPKHLLLMDNEDKENVVGRQAKILDIAGNLGIPVIDAYDSFPKERAPESFFSENRGHFNAKGYAILADAVLKAIAP